MFKIRSIHIAGFWQTHKARAQFKSDVNIIIGKNGTGKTTFMNIVHAVLSVDVEALYDNAFKSVLIVLSDGNRTRTIRAQRVEKKSFPFQSIEYRISNRRFSAPLLGGEEARSLSPIFRRRATEEYQRIKQELGEIVSVASLSVYRIGGDPDPEVRDRSLRRHVSPVDARLQGLTQRLTQYQLELSGAAREISAQLQRDVLTSLLFAADKRSDRAFSLEFDQGLERQNLASAYRQLGVSGSEVSKKIQDHISAVGKAVLALKAAAEARGRGEPIPEGDIAWAALDAFRLTRAVVDMSLEAEKKTNDVFRQVELFTKTLGSFIEDKAFTFASGELVVKTEGPLSLARLSSGEKQLLILLIEALLQKQKPYIFLADEPELSLHISWQRKILSAVRSINPNAQVVVATHSPEIAGKFPGSLLDMEDILRD